MTHTYYNDLKALLLFSILIDKNRGKYINRTSHKIIIIFFLSISLFTIAQQDSTKNRIPDSLLVKSYQVLNEEYKIHNTDKYIARLHAEAYLLKAKIDKDIIKQADGYYMLAKVSEQSIAIKYADTIITLTKNIKDFKYPAEGHLFKAQFFGSKSYYKKAMDELIKANHYANDNGNIDQSFRIKYYIALLRNNLGEYEEALQMFNSCMKFYKEKNIEEKKYRSQYIRSLVALGDSYNRNKKYDSAGYITKKGIDLSLVTKDSLFYDRLLLSSGIIDYYKGRYQSSLDSITKFQNLYYDEISNNGNLVKSDLYLGNIYNKTKDFDKSIQYYKKVDSVVFEKRYFFTGVHLPYENLIEFYKKNQDVEEQLFYINRLLIVDSILDTDFKNTYDTMVKEYTTPNLLSEKEEIIDSLKENNKIRTVLIFILILLSITFLLFWYKNYRKKTIYQQRFQELFAKKEQDSYTTDNKLVKKEKPDDIGISNDIVEGILEKLSKFEEKQGFLQSNITVSLLSKELKTNSKYLSKTINAYKQKSFSNYINDLRIYFIIDTLKKEPKIRKYTIKAISLECGFNTTEAFSKSFHKTTGIYPSFFIKQLDKKG